MIETIKKSSQHGHRNTKLPESVEIALKKYRFRQNRLRNIRVSPSKVARASEKLLLAAEYGNKDMVDYWLKHGADISSTNNAGRNALMCAAFNGHVETVNFLLKNCTIDIDKRNKYGNNALDYAQSFYTDGHIKTAEALRKQGADYGYSALSRGLL